MKCPDCGGSLIDITLVGIDKSHRCFRCGGVFVRDASLRILPVRALDSWPVTHMDSLMMISGENLCPQDNIPLKEYKGGEIPAGWNVRRCDVCKDWWFPTDTLFRLRTKAMERGGYAKMGDVIFDKKEE